MISFQGCVLVDQDHRFVLKSGGDIRTQMKKTCMTVQQYIFKRGFKTKNVNTCIIKCLDKLIHNTTITLYNA